MKFIAIAGVVLGVQLVAGQTSYERRMLSRGRHAVGPALAAHDLEARGVLDALLDLTGLGPDNNDDTSSSSTTSSSAVSSAPAPSPSTTASSASSSPTAITDPTSSASVTSSPSIGPTSSATITSTTAAPTSVSSSSSSSSSADDCTPLVLLGITLGCQPTSSTSSATPTASSISSTSDSDPGSTITVGGSTASSSTVTPPPSTSTTTAVSSSTTTTECTPLAVLGITVSACRSSTATATEPATTTAPSSGSSSSAATGTGTGSALPSSTDVSSGTDAPTTTAPPTTDTPTSSASSSSTNSCEPVVVLGITVLPCASSSASPTSTSDDPTTPPPDSTSGTTTTTSTSSTPTSDPCDPGLLDIVGGLLSLPDFCTSTSTTSTGTTNSGTGSDGPTTTSTDSPTTSTPDGPGDTTTTTTTSTSDTDTVTDSGTTTATLTVPTDIFPGNTTTSDSATFTSSSTETVPTDLPSVSIPTYVTQTSSLLIETDLPTTQTIVPTQTDPDAIETTPSPAEQNNAPTPTKAVLPNNLPSYILAATAPDKAPDGYVLITLMLGSDLNWDWVASNSETALQIITFAPLAVVNALRIPQSRVVMLALEAFIPEGWNKDPKSLLTLVEMYIPEESVDELAAQLRAANSRFYTAQGNQVETALVAEVDPSYPLTSGSSSNAPGSGPAGNLGGLIAPKGDDNKDDARQRAIIGVCAAVGGALALALAYWLYKYIQRQREGGHRRLNEGQLAYGGPGYGAVAAGPVMAQERGRRDSFFFAADSLRGYEDGTARMYDDETYDHRSGSGHGHGAMVPPRSPQQGPIVPSSISAPILRQNTLNW